MRPTEVRGREPGSPPRTRRQRLRFSTSANPNSTLSGTRIRASQRDDIRADFICVHPCASVASSLASRLESNVLEHVSGRDVGKDPEKGSAFDARRKLSPQRGRSSASEERKTCHGLVESPKAVGDVRSAGVKKNGQDGLNSEPRKKIWPQINTDAHR